MAKLKPCPFCGGKAAIYGTYREGEAAIYPWIYSGIYDVRCQKCNAGFGDTYTTEELVIEKWNRRANEDGKETHGMTEMFTAALPDGYMVRFTTPSKEKFCAVEKECQRQIDERRVQDERAD